MAIRSMEGHANQSPPEPFSTRDFYLAAALLAKGAHFLRVDRQGPVGFFMFSDSKRCEAWVVAYFQDELKVSAKEMTSAIRSLKDALFSAKVDH